MAGLIQSRMAPQDEGANEQMGPPGESEGAADEQGQPGGQQGSQQDYERVVLAGMKVIYDQGVSEQLIQMMQKAPNPAQGLASATLLIMRELYQKSNGSIPPQLIAPAAKQIMQFIAELGQAAKIMQPTPQLIQQAFDLATQQLMQQRGANPGVQPGTPPGGVPAQVQPVAGQQQGA